MCISAGNVKFGDFTLLSRISRRTVISPDWPDYWKRTAYLLLLLLPRPLVTQTAHTPDPHSPGHSISSDLRDKDLKNKHNSLIVLLFRAATVSSPEGWTLNCEGESFTNFFWNWILILCTRSQLVNWSAKPLSLIAENINSHTRKSLHLGNRSLPFGTACSSVIKFPDNSNTEC